MLAAPLSWVRSWRATLATLLLAAVVLLPVLHWHDSMPLCQSWRYLPVPYLAVVDSESYLRIAQGRVAEVESPFSKRQLHPLLARGISQASGMTLPDAFLLLAVLSYLGLVACLAEWLRDCGRSPFWALLPAWTPLALESVLLGYLNDLFHMSLLALFFLLLLRRQNVAALAVLFIAFLVRESTLLVCGVMMVLAWRRKQRDLLIGTAVVLVTGWLCSSAFGRMGQPNVHRLPELAYLPMKVLYNGTFNFLGLFIWTNVKSGLGTPSVIWEVPTWLPLGENKQIGLILAPQFAARTYLSFLTAFGTAPLLLWWWWRRRQKEKSLPFAAALALVYGALAFFAGPALGAWVFRLVGYGWPAMWLALPMLLTREPPLRPGTTLALLAAALVAAWTSTIGGYDPEHITLGEWTAFRPTLLLLFPYAATLWLLWRSAGLSTSQPPARRPQ